MNALPPFSVTHLPIKPMGLVRLPFPYKTLPSSSAYSSARQGDTVEHRGELTGMIGVAHAQKCAYGGESKGVE